MAFWKKIETWHVGLSCQYTHFMSFSSKSEHDTVADQATLIPDSLDTCIDTCKLLREELKGKGLGFQLEAQGLHLWLLGLW